MKPITLFLDIDGVIATSRQYNIKRFSKRWINKYDVYPFDPDCVRILNEILEYPKQFGREIEIVLHTDWIYHFTLGEMTDIFEINGVSQPPVQHTGHLYSMDRLRDRFLRIEHFIKDYGLKDFFILDDMDLKSRAWPGKFIHVPRESEGIKQSGLKKKILEFIDTRF